jgi:hypothetical protein
VHQQTKEWLGDRLEALESHFDADAVFYYGVISAAYDKLFRDFIETLAAEGKHKRLLVLLNTVGGSAETVEKMVRIIRFHYEEIYFVVPDFAMSAGTILCMSGDKIFMDYSSSLGPIDPQVWNGKEWVPALGYLDKVEELLEKARQNQLTDAEFLILQGQDLATLSRYEQQRNLTVTLLKQWLVQFKFKDWQAHGSSATKKGQPVTADEKQERAEEVARILGNNKHWHSHGRMIGPETLRGVLRLVIEDYSADAKLKMMIRSYNDLIVEFVLRNNYEHFLHSRNFF